MTERIALDIHAHLAPVFPDDLDSVEGVTWKADAKLLSVDGHDVGMKPLPSHSFRMLCPWSPLWELSIHRSDTRMERRFSVSHWGYRA